LKSFGLTKLLTQTILLGNPLQPVIFAISGPLRDPLARSTYQANGADCDSQASGKNSTNFHRMPAILAAHPAALRPKN